MELNKIVRNNLLEVKNLKENTTIREEIIKSRISILLENFENSSQEKKDETKIKLVFEMLDLNEEGMLEKPSNLKKSFSKLFGDSFINLGFDSVFEPLTHAILKEIGLPEGTFRNAVVDRLTSNSTQLWESLQNCEELSQIISEAIIQTSLLFINRDFNFSGGIFSFLRKEIHESLLDPDVVEELQYKINNSVCLGLKKLDSRISQVTDKFKR